MPCGQHCTYIRPRPKAGRAGGPSQLWRLHSAISRTEARCDAAMNEICRLFELEAAQTDGQNQRRRMDWTRQIPWRAQFQIEYRSGDNYEPDFIIGTNDRIFDHRGQGK